jgi:hypothetical protein
MLEHPPSKRITNPDNSQARVFMFSLSPSCRHFTLPELESVISSTASLFPYFRLSVSNDEDNV